MTRSEALNELGAALAAAQGELTGAKKDATNPFFKMRYADLASVWEACRAPLSKHGLAVAQCPRLVSAGEGAWLVEVETMLLHSSGQWISETLAVPVLKSDAQGVGSALTYARRYTLAAMVGVAPDDDDGEASVARPVARPATVGTPAALPTSDRGAAMNDKAPAGETHAEKIARLKAEAAAKRASAQTGSASGYDAPIPEDEEPPADSAYVPVYAVDPPAVDDVDEAPKVNGKGDVRVAGVKPMQGPMVMKDGVQGPSWVLYVVTFTGKVKAENGLMVADAATFDEKLAAAALDAKDAKTLVSPRIEPNPKKKGSFKLIAL